MGNRGSVVQSEGVASGFLNRRWTAPFVVAVCSALTLVVWGFAAQFTAGLERDRREDRADELAVAIGQRMRVYEQVLWSGVGLMNASEHVDRGEWRVFTETLRIHENWPGIQGIGFAIPLAASEVAAHEAAIQAEGFPDYRVHTREETLPPERSAIVYLEPFDERNQRAFGYDMWSNEMRRQAMARARDEGVAATSGIITLVQEEASGDVQRGFLTYVPYYDAEGPLETAEQRRAAFRGWVYAPFRAGDLLQGVLDGTSIVGAFELYDGPAIRDEDRLVAGRSVGAETTDFKDAVVRNMVVQGRQWTLRVSASNLLSASERGLPLAVLLGGVCINLLLYLALRSAYDVQRRAEDIAQQMTRELEERARDLRARNDELSQFAYVASHDLQEPLRTVSNFVQMLELRYSDSFDDRGRQALQFIVEATARMSRLIHALLDFSRIGVGHEPETVDCNALMREVRDDLSAALAECDGKLGWDSLPVVHGLEPELRRLFLNLVNNAIKFRREGVSPIVQVRSIERDDVWEFRVTDNGIGVAADDAQRIFGIFQRLHRRDEYEGSGIGLAHCKKIVDLHAGEIGVEAHPEGGSVFWFTLARDTDGRGMG